MRRFLDARAERAAGRARAKAARRAGAAASAANATNESGGEAEIAGRALVQAWGRDAEFTERSWGGS